MGTAGGGEPGRRSQEAKPRGNNGELREEAHRGEEVTRGEEAKEGRQSDAAGRKAGRFADERRKRPTCTPPRGSFKFSL